MSDELTIEEILDFFKDQLADVLAELSDPKYLSITHGVRKNECRGPLCKKRGRDEHREYNERKAAKNGEKYTPYGRKWDRDELLDAITEWHRKKVFEGRYGNERYIA